MVAIAEDLPDVLAVSLLPTPRDTSVRLREGIADDVEEALDLLDHLQRQSPVC
jgi:hypothetical protein